VKVFVSSAFIAALLLTAPAWAQSEKFKPGQNPESNQAYSAAAITPSDTVKILVTRGIYVGDAAACNITMTLNGDTVAVLFSNAQPGQILPFQAILVKATGTTCASLVALR
jgi:hypothetical protein